MAQTNIILYKWTPFGFLSIKQFFANTVFYIFKACRNRRNRDGINKKIFYMIILQFDLFVFLQFGRPLLYLPWSAAWALYHFIWVCLEGYWWSLKSHYVTLDWFRQLSNVGYTVLTAFALVDFFIAFYAYCLAPRLAHVGKQTHNARNQNSKNRK